MAHLPEPSAAPPRGVIHDIGYRPYAGERRAEGDIVRALFLTGLRNAWGLGRSGRSKILPFVLLGIDLVPALIMVAVMVVVGLDSPPVSYAGYAGTTQMLISVFVAAQAPILFSRDLRHGSIVLYLSRPLHAASYALARWASLVVALLIFTLTPVLLLYLGALLANSDAWQQTKDAGAAVLLAVLLSMLLASVAGLISSWSTRRGFAVIASIAVLLLGDGVISAVQGIAYAQDRLKVGEYAGFLSPFRLYRGISESVFDQSASAITPPTGTLMEAAYVAAVLLVALGGAWLLVWRYRREATR